MGMGAGVSAKRVELAESQVGKTKCMGHKGN